jgi:hypothetical protein
MTDRRVVSVDVDNSEQMPADVRAQLAIDLAVPRVEVDPDGVPVLVIGE